MNVNRLATSWHKLPRQRFARTQAKRLRAYLRDVVLPFHPRYRDLFFEPRLDWRAIGSLEDLERIPFTTKSDLSGGPDRTRQFVIAPDPQQARAPSGDRLAWTSERTGAGEAASGKRVPAGFDDQHHRTFRGTRSICLYRARSRPCSERQATASCNWQGALERSHAEHVPFAPHLAFWQTHYAGTEFGVFLVSSGEERPSAPTETSGCFGKLSPDVLIGMPTFVYHALREAALDGVRCENLRGIVLGGEKVPPSCGASSRNARPNFMPGASR